MKTPSPEILQSVAVQAARRGGLHALTNKERRDEIHQSFSHDVKLELDIECQRIIEQTITSACPGHRIVGEEDTGTESNRGNGLEWIIDPIDGTVNFSHGLPIWCCSVAVRSDTEVLAGAVFAPELNLLYEASINTPALCNGTPITVSETDALLKSLVFTGADKDEKTTAFRFFNAIADKVQRPRISGSAALDICQVAAGNADGYFEPKIYIWDIAAAALILRQAGGTHITFDQPEEHALSCLATTGKIHSHLLELLEPEISG